MRLESFTYQAGHWSVSQFPELDSPQTAVLVFGASAYADDKVPIRQLLAAFPNSHIVGCSTSGEICKTTLLDDSLVVTVVRFERTELATARAVVDSAENSFSAGTHLGQALHRPHLRGILVLSDGLHVNGSELVRGLNAVVPPSVVITGGLAGDGADFKRTWVIHNSLPQSRLVSAIGFYGDHVTIGHGSKGGWDIFGPERRVTRSEGHILYELDGKPALELYKLYLGERANELPAAALLFPLALRTNQNDEKSIVRTVLSIDEQKNAMIFAGDVPQGALAQLMKANFDRLIDGASNAALMVDHTRLDNSNTLCIAISCVGRRLVLGERAEEELEATLEALPTNTHQAGFYSYGEISPYTTDSGQCDLHNQTMTLTTIAET